MPDRTQHHDAQVERALIETYAARDITREQMLDRLAAGAVSSRSDPTGGEGHVRGTRDVVERATREGLLTEDDWNAIAARAATCPALLATDS